MYCLLELCVLGARRSPRAKHRFGFSDPVQPGLPMLEVEEEPFNDDDILDSLTRRAEFGRRLGGGLGGSPEPTLSLSGEGRSHPPLTGTGVFVPGRRGHGQYAFPLMVLGGGAGLFGARAFRGVSGSSL